MSLLSDLVNLNLSDSTKKIIAEYIWSVTFHRIILSIISLYTYISLKYRFFSTWLLFQNMFNSLFCFSFLVFFHILCFACQNNQIRVFFFFFLYEVWFLESFSFQSITGSFFGGLIFLFWNVEMFFSMLWFIICKLKQSKILCFYTKF